MRLDRFGSALAGLLQNLILLEISSVVGLNLVGNSTQSTLEGLFGRGVRHLGLAGLASDGWQEVGSHLDSGFVWGPGDECNLASVNALDQFLRMYNLSIPNSFAVRKLVVEVLDCVSATNALLALLVLGLGVDKLRAELLPILALGQILNHNLGLVVGQLEDDVLYLLALLELVELGDTVLIDLDSVYMSVPVCDGRGAPCHGRWCMIRGVYVGHYYPEVDYAGAHVSRCR